MATEITSKSYSSQGPIQVKPMDDDSFRQRMQNVYDKIGQRAYELFEGRGRQDGRDMEDWLRAEAELLYPTAVDISESSDKLIVHAEMPGFREKDIEVRVKPHCLVITGQKQQSSNQTDRKAVLSERTSEELFRIVDLPQEIDPSKVTTMLQQGILEVDLPKVRPGKPMAVASHAA